MYPIRLAVPEDAATLAQQRYQMSIETGRADNSDIRACINAFEHWAAEMLRQGKYIGWLTMFEDQVIAGTGLLILDWPPCVLDPLPYRGYLLNMYVNPEHRRKRLASTMIDAALAEARRRKIRVVSLHATETGQTVYANAGFRRTNEMLYLDRQGNS